MKPRFTEKGQVLIIIAIAGVVLFAFTALAVDGGMVYSVKRQAQNAADAAALSAALSKVRGGNWQQAGIDSAKTNTFNTDGTNEVTVLPCTDPNADCSAIPQGADPSEYIYVKIIARVTTNFTRVVGISQVAQVVNAVARAVPGYYDAIAYGNAVVALNKTACQAFVIQGNVDVHTVGGGLFVNSTCDSGLFTHGSITVNTPSVTVAGSTATSNITPITYDAPQLPAMTLPDPSCGNMVATKNGDTLSAGTWNGGFPPSGVKHLSGGIYCVHGSFSMNGGATLDGSNVVIRMDSGGISWNGGATVTLSAPTSGPYEGLLIFVPPSNTSGTITFNGNGVLTLTGTILAPGSAINMLGTAQATKIDGQVVGDTVKWAGNFKGTVNYDDTKNYQSFYAPTVEQTQ